MDTNTAPGDTMIRIAASVAADIAAGADTDSAVRNAAEALGVSTGAVAHCVATVAAWMNEPAEGWKP